MTPRYTRVVLAWAVPALVPSFVAVVLIAMAIEAICGDDSTDCSWGFELLLVIPVLLFSMIVLAPLSVFATLRRVGDPLATRTTFWALGLVVPSIALAYVTFGIAIVVVPPLAGRYFALRSLRS